MAALGDKDIGGFDVAVDNSLRMRSIQCVGDLNRQTEQSLGLDSFSGNAMFQRQPVKEFHRDECLPVLLAHVVNRADVGMVQCGSGLSFALKAGECLWVTGDLLR